MKKWSWVNWLLLVVAVVVLGTLLALLVTGVGCGASGSSG